jgi:hypothetical protein
LLNRTFSISTPLSLNPGSPPRHRVHRVIVFLLSGGARQQKVICLIKGIIG